MVAFQDSAPSGFTGLALITSAIGLKGQVRARPLAEAKRIRLQLPPPSFSGPLPNSPPGSLPGSLSGSLPGSLSSGSLIPSLKQVWLRSASGWRLTKLLSCSPRGSDFCLSLSCSRNRQDAESLVGVRLGMVRGSRAAAPETSQTPLLWSDLVGREVRSTTEDLLGHVDRLETNGQQDWVVVGQHYIPLVEKHIVSLGSDSTPMVVHWERDWT
jgi:ribosomal 30S subunit maturation factor RimM